MNVIGSYLAIAGKNNIDEVLDSKSVALLLEYIEHDVFPNEMYFSTSGTYLLLPEQMILPAKRFLIDVIRKLANASELTISNLVIGITNEELAYGQLLDVDFIKEFSEKNLPPKSGRSLFDLLSFHIQGAVMVTIRGAATALCIEKENVARYHTVATIEQLVHLFVVHSKAINHEPVERMQIDFCDAEGQPVQDPLEENIRSLLKKKPEVNPQDLIHAVDMLYVPHYNKLACLYTLSVQQGVDGEFKVAVEHVFLEQYGSPLENMNQILDYIAEGADIEVSPAEFVTAVEKYFLRSLSTTDREVFKTEWAEKIRAIAKQEGAEVPDFILRGGRE